MARQEEVILDFSVDEAEGIQSIEALTKANQKLREERKKLNLETADGQKRIKEINAQLDSNNNKIKENSSALEKQRFNVGNYRKDIEASIPAFGRFSQAQDVAGKAATGLRLALGPIGILIGVIVAAVTILIKSFAGTQEGMDKITRVTRPLVAIFDKLIGVLQELGGRLFKALGDAIENPKQAFIDLGNAIKENVINRFEALALFGPAIAKIFSGDISGGFKDLGDAVIQAGTGIENAIDKIKGSAGALSDFVDEAIKQGLRLDELQKQIERGEIDQIKRSKELNFIVKQNKTIVEDETKSFEKRINAALTARTAQNAILSDELNLLDKRIEKLKLQQSLNDTSREDEKELAELEAQRFEAQASNAEQSIEFDKKITELRKKQSEALAEQAAIERATRRAQNQLDTQTEDPLSGAFATQLDKEQELDIVQRFNKRIVEDEKKRTDEIVAERKRRAELEEEVERSKLQIIAGFLGSISGLVKQDTAEYKVLASAEALINTYLAATAALASGSKINPIFGIISAAAAVANGLATVARINGIEFAEGGWTGPGDKYKPVGVVHADEYVAPKWIVNNPKAQPHIAALENMRLRGYADGGLVVNTVTQPINQQMELANVVKNLPPGVVDVREVTKAQNKIKVKEALSKK